MKCDVLSQFVGILAHDDLKYEEKDSRETVATEDRVLDSRIVTTSVRNVRRRCQRS